MHPGGFEPTHLAALEPESSVYANFTTGANGEIRYQNEGIKASDFSHKIKCDIWFYFECNLCIICGMNTAIIFSMAMFASTFQCSDAVKAKARDFIDNEKQFHLGFLPTEQSNPITATLEEDFKRSTLAGV